MIRFFKSPQPTVLFIIPLIILPLWIQAFFIHPFVVTDGGTFLYQAFAGWLAKLPAFLVVFFAFALITLEAIYLNTIVNRHEVLYKQSYLPALLYALLMSMSVTVLNFHPLVLVNLILLRALDKTFMLFKNDSPISPLFDAAFLFAISSLFYLPAILFFILYLIALAILRPFNMREWIISCIGFALPYFFLGIYFFLEDQFTAGWKSFFEGLIPRTLPSVFHVDQPMLFLLIVVGTLLLISLLKLMGNFYKNTIRTRSSQQILMLFLLVSIASSFWMKAIPYYQITMLAIPAAVFLGYYFLSAKRRIWISELLLWMMIVLIIWNHF